MKASDIQIQAQWLVDRGVVDAKWKSLVIETFSDPQHDALVDMVKKLRGHLGVLEDLLGNDGYFRRSEDVVALMYEADELLKGEK